MFSSKKSKLMGHKIKNKKTLVLHLDNIYKLAYLKNIENALKKYNCAEGTIFSV
jgi:hypothetical protein